MQGDRLNCSLSSPDLPAPTSLGRRSQGFAYHALPSSAPHLSYLQEGVAVAVLWTT